MRDTTITTECGYRYDLRILPTYDPYAVGSDIWRFVK